MPKLEFIQLLKSNGYPDHYYVCTSDPQPDNPMVYSTDCEDFFKSLHVEGRLKDFLNHCLAASELIDLIKARIESSKNQFTTFSLV